MKKSYFVLFTALFIFANAFAVAAQPDGYVEVDVLRSSLPDKLYCRTEQSVFNSMPTFRPSEQEKCIEVVNSLNVNFERETLIHWQAGGDCNMRAAVKVFRSDVDKRVRVIVNSIYGGCKAVGHRSGWLVIENPAADYEISVEDVKVDRIHGINAETDGFVFPKPPPVVTTSDIFVRTVDMADCLKLTGQSQWVISKRDILYERIANTPDAERCTGHFQTLNVNFETETLVGVSFASGYCHRPEGLEITALKETSTDPRGNRIVLRARYDPVGTNACKVWTTYPVWVVLPKIEQGFRFDLDSAARPQTAGLP